MARTSNIFVRVEPEVKEQAEEILDELGIPYQKPAGGHGIFLDAAQFYPQVPWYEFPGQVLSVELYKEGGIRGWLAKRAAACVEAERRKDPLLQFTAEPDKGHAHALEHFVEQIRGIRHEEVCGVDDAVLATRVAFAAIRSAREKRPVRMAEIQA